MDECCKTKSVSAEAKHCPECQKPGRSVNIVTLKALLIPSAMEVLRPDASYLFCSNPECGVVYFADAQKFHIHEVKVQVYQKDQGLDVPVCYCFGWTRRRLSQGTQKGEQPIENISGHIRGNRCGCELNNPQGTCCLGNVRAYTNAIQMNY